MSISKTFTPKDIEEKWYKHWEHKGYFSSKPDNRDPYTIVIPPPNVTGVLHLGHTLNNTLQDVLIRKARMQGKNACWVPGTDHASIATETKVVEMLKERGISKKDINRDGFMKYAWEWKDKYGGIILKQLRRLGASCDWDRTRFTMEEDLYDAVIEVFVDLYNKGLIYRGVRMVNWDPKGLTALSDEEVEHKEEQSKLYYIQYPIEGIKEHIVIATTRPETMLGDTAVCVHPKDDRYKAYHGKNIIVPLVDRSIPLIKDDYVEMDFGTGALKVTPAHDENDYMLGEKHNLESIDIFNDNGTLNDRAQLYVGVDRFEARKSIVKELKEKGYLIKIEEITNKIGYSQRTNTVIEPKLSLQWFFKMSEVTKPALQNVMNDTIRFVPTKFKNIYRHWLENIKDWCISRQLWWGQRIPAYFYNGNKYVVAKTIEEALALAQREDPNLTINDLKQDEDVLDTWFSSWLWPISVFDGFKNPDNEEINYYYPTNVLVTGQDIIFFWVARMIMAGYEYKNALPFKDVYFTGMVRDKQGRKMSKSLGNSPDLLKILDEYGADGVRAGVLFSSPAGNDLLFDEKQCAQGRNFCNKIWNALRLVKGWEVENNGPDLGIAHAWYRAKLDQAVIQINNQFDQYRISEAMMTVYRLFWDDFCSWYLEMVKPNFGEAIASKDYEEVLVNFEDSLKLMHPFLPFVSEEVWHQLNIQDVDLMISDWPCVNKLDNSLLERGETIKSLVSALRNVRVENKLKPKESLSLYIKTKDFVPYQDFELLIKKLAFVNQIEQVQEKIENARSFLISTDECFVPIQINVAEEVERLQKEISYNKGFLVGVRKKLSNERFVSNAPEAVVQKEKQKQQDAEEKIKLLEESLSKLM